MFGKPEWFRPKALAFGLVPVRWQGWLYAGSWAGAISLPFLLLVGREQPLEAAAWLGLSFGALAYDVRQILRTLRGPAVARSTAMVVRAPRQEKDVLYINA